MINTTSIVASLALALGVGAIGCKKTAKDNPRVDTTKVVEPRAADNTGVNERDRKDGETTAQNAGLGQSDTDIMAKIRASVVDDGDLSTNAHNVKIVAENGVVTLKGPVGSEAERTAVAAKASAVVGADKVVNELEIAP